MSPYVLLTLFGALGTLARALLNDAIQKAAGPGFPWGIVAVNLLGSFLFGAVFAATEGHAAAKELRFVALTGFMGAFTTFSTLMFDTVKLGEAGRLGAAAGNVALQNGAGLLCVVVGFAVGRGVSG